MLIVPFLGNASSMQPDLYMYSATVQASMLATCEYVRHVPAHMPGAKYREYLKRSVNIDCQTFSFFGHRRLHWMLHWQLRPMYIGFADGMLSAWLIGRLVLFRNVAPSAFQRPCMPGVCLHAMPCACLQAMPAHVCTIAEHTDLCLYHLAFSLHARP